MPYSKVILCLACSTKPHGRCVAGKELVGGRGAGWIRPVTPGAHSAITNAQRRYADQFSAVALDVVEIQFDQPQQTGFQAENHLIQVPSQWRFIRKHSVDNLAAFVDAPATLWTNTCPNPTSGSGVNNRVNGDLLEGQRMPSLYLIAVNRLTVLVSEVEGGRDYRGTFTYNEVAYKLKITDPKFHDSFAQQPVGEHEVVIRFLTISLGEVFEVDNYAYKLIAAVFR